MTIVDAGNCQVIKADEGSYQNIIVINNEPKASIGRYKKIRLIRNYAYNGITR